MTKRFLKADRLPLVGATRTDNWFRVVYTDRTGDGLGAMGVWADQVSAAYLLCMYSEADNDPCEYLIWLQSRVLNYLTQEMGYDAAEMKNYYWTYGEMTDAILTHLNEPAD